MGYVALPDLGAARHQTLEAPCVPCTSALRLNAYTFVETPEGHGMFSSRSMLACAAAASLHAPRQQCWPVVTLLHITKRCHSIELLAVCRALRLARMQTGQCSRGQHACTRSSIKSGCSTERSRPERAASCRTRRPASLARPLRCEHGLLGISRSCKAQLL